MAEVELPAGAEDLRGNPTRVPFFKDKPYAVPRRPWSSVRGVTLHQTSCYMSEHAERYFHTGAHAVVTPLGHTFILSCPTWRLIHGDAFNSYDVGLEMMGAYEGIAGKPSTFWKGANCHPMTPTPELVEAAKAVVRYWARLVAANGGKLRFIHAHRQGSPTRQSDPGSALWQAVALPLQEELGLTAGPVGWATNGGRPIPEAWDPRCKGVRY